jgi:hypothetical protein
MKEIGNQLVLLQFQTSSLPMNEALNFTCVVAFCYDFIESQAP